jgi:tetratricopeptide (TPR) repeat protein
MNLRRCFALLQLLFPLAAACTALSQETITLRDGQVQPVHILGMTSSGLNVQIGQAEMVEPFGNFTAVSMTPPPEFVAAQAAYESGDLQQALTLDSSVVTNYRGLPTDWAREAMQMLGDLYLALNQPAQAQAAYKDYQQAYPGASPDEVAVGLAGVDLANNDPAAAGAKLAPILQHALQQRNPPPPVAELYGRAFFVSGKVKEHTGDLQGALEDYLRAAAVFPEDRVAAAGAQAAADNLRKAHSNVTVP